jgi:hypothetical protein
MHRHHRVMYVRDQRTYAFPKVDELKSQSILSQSVR